MSIEENQYSILFVEDEKEIRDNYIKYLKRHFTNVYEAVDGEEAYKIYKEKRPEIMIVDIHIPTLNGIELVKKIREYDQIVKVIMLTAYSDVKYLLEAVQLKLSKYLVKPVTRSELKEALDVAIDEFSKFDIVHKELLHLSDGYTWNCKTKELYYKNQELALTNKEKQIASLLLENPNIIFSYDDIISDIWGFTEEDKLDPLKTLVKNTRKKLPKNTIKNIFGVGYKF